jgi:glyoxylase-like metal-dependent hydrolase (beta-lactamase superfamily II)/8-oxo-dGTP pyrophosphatase MutT (NUDIX family)
MAFAADMHVFPGGRVDAADRDQALAARSVNGASDAAVALGGDIEGDLALAVFIAAVRELFEEAGVLLADASDGAAAIPARSVGLARSALVGGEATFAQIAQDLDLRLRTDLLAPLSRWVTPPVMPRRFDARFFAAELPPGSRVSFEGDEVASHAWLTPRAGLAAMAEGRLAMWVPTSTTLQQLEHVRSMDEIQARLSPGILGSIAVEELSPAVTRIVMPAGGGVAGQPVCAYLVGRRRFVLIDPGDPTGPALDRAIEVAATRGGAIEAVALTHVDPDHAAGAEAVAERLAVPILGGPGAGRAVPFEVHELTDGASLPAGDVALQIVHAPGPRPDHVAFVAEASRIAIVGDLDGVRGTRSIPGPTDERAWAASRERIEGFVPADRWLTGHPRSGSRG